MVSTIQVFLAVISDLERFFSGKKKGLIFNLGF